MSKFISLFLAVFYLSGCTAVGFLADVAIINAVDKNPELSDVLNDELVLTELGSNVDAKIIANIVQAIPKSKANNKIVEYRSAPMYGKCERTLNDGEKCYDAEYYQQFRDEPKAE